MWSYYDLVVAQDTDADRLRSAGYPTSPAANREVTQEAITRHFNEQHQNKMEEKEAARRTALAAFANTVKALFRNRAALVR